MVLVWLTLIRIRTSWLSWQVGFGGGGVKLLSLTFYPIILKALVTDLLMTVSPPTLAHHLKRLLP